MYGAEQIEIDGQTFWLPTSAEPFILFEKAVRWGCNPAWSSATPGYVRPDTLDDLL